MTTTKTKSRINLVKYALVAILMILFLLVGIKRNYTKLTFLEYSIVNDKPESTIVLDSRESVLEQEFVAPYSIMSGLSLRTGTFGRDCNSNWVFDLVDENGQLVYSTVMNASQFADNDYINIDFDNNLVVDKGSTYILKVYSEDVEPGSIVQFWCNSNNTLCLKLFGSDFDYWWIAFFIFEWLVISALILRALYIHSKGRNLTEDTVIQVFVLGIIFFLMKSSFSVIDTFLDEYDNCAGGITIAQGGVLYREYITQHTPFLYYLCAIFAFLKASSLEQFRLCYYACEAIAWCLIFTRNKKSIGTGKAFMLPIVETVIISTIVGDRGAQILSDSVQGICFVTLLLELYSYLKDHVIDWKRSIIVSVCIWSSVGSAFVSAFSLIWIVVGVLASEAFLIYTKGKSVKAFINGFYKLLIAVIVPPILACIYFAANHCLYAGYVQAYEFNREVYPLYSGGYGTSILSPFIDSVRYFVLTVSEDVLSIVNGNSDLIIIMRLIVMVSAFIFTIVLIKRKNYLLGTVLLMTGVCAASRGYGFHAIAAYYVFIMISVVFFVELKRDNTKSIIALSLVCLILSCNYVACISNNMNKKQETVDAVNLALIDLTEEGESVFYDENLVNPLYVMYKGRHIVNRQPYLLPWAMDVFEQDCIDDLLSTSPNYVVYNDCLSAWDYPYGQNRFLDLLQRDYDRLSDDPNAGWPYLLWVKK